MWKGTIRGRIELVIYPWSVKADGSYENFVRETVIGKGDGKRFWTASEHCSRR